MDTSGEERDWPDKARFNRILTDDSTVLNPSPYKVQEFSQTRREKVVQIEGRAYDLPLSGI
jgi:hypothetical protein